MTYLFVCTEMKLFLLQLVIKGLDADPYCFQAALNEPYAAVAFIASHDALPQRHSLPLPPASSRLGWQGAPPRPSCWSANGKAFVLFVGERERSVTLRSYLHCTCCEDDDGCSKSSAAGPRNWDSRIPARGRRTLADAIASPSETSWISRRGEDENSPHISFQFSNFCRCYTLLLLS